MTQLGADLPRNPDVVVVGAGSAGVGAARRLVAEGKSVVVVEAAGRIGGRAYTESDTFGVPFDRGCSWLQGPKSLPHLALAHELGFTLSNQFLAEHAFHIDGAPAGEENSKLLERAIEVVDQSISRIAEDVPVANVIPQDTPFIREAQVLMAISYAADLPDLSTGDANAFIDYEIDYLVREGLGTLVANLGRDLPVKLNTAVSAVDWSGDGVRIETNAGTIAASACIVTVSTGVLRSGAIRFTPDLPAEKHTALEGLPMGLLTKIPLQFDGARFGLKENAGLSTPLSPETPDQACSFLTFPTGLDLVVGFAGGAFAWQLSAEGGAAAIDFALGEFVKAVGSDARKHFVKGDMSDWHANPLTLGAYAYALPGRHADRAVLKEPLGDRVFFAGEHVAMPLTGLCSGAHLSGEAAANAVLAALGAQSELVGGVAE